MCNGTDDPAGIPGCDDMAGNIMGYDGTGTYDNVIANGDARVDDNVAANPDIRSNGDRFGVFQIGIADCGVDGMTGRIDTDVRC